MSRHEATEASLSLPMKRALVAAKLQQQVGQIVRQAALEAPLPERTTHCDPADGKALRGIPAVGRNVAGHIDGTQPEQQTIRTLMREPRGGYDGRRAGQHGTVKRWIT